MSSTKFVIHCLQTSGGGKTEPRNLYGRYLSSHGHDATVPGMARQINGDIYILCRMILLCASTSGCYFGKTSTGTHPLRDLVFEFM